ncbi:hypothetical protein DQX05_29735 [Paenibacillus thiaminolyticus]|uniref:Uncharacterized protein n=1 Tax=Paenibacillus thiaminolyticus TaxID=49283 RepID=A0A3A3G9M7_PANTH|nr:hypothetical protein DQX05_29735 [Paenibacillus thiaminolyticus]
MSLSALAKVIEYKSHPEGIEWFWAAEATVGTSETRSKKETKTDNNLAFIRINLFSYSFLNFFTMLFAVEYGSEKTMKEVVAKMMCRSEGWQGFENIKRR